MDVRHAFFQVIFLLLACLFSAPTFAALTDHFVTTWKTDNPGTSNSTSITVPMLGGPYDVDWDNDGTFDQFGMSGKVTHNYGVAGTYTIRIYGSYDSIRFYSAGDELKILSLDQWGSNSWTTMESAFAGAVNLYMPAIDIPDFSVVTSMQAMFNQAALADPDTSDWDTSAVTNMLGVFSGATSANPDVSGWNTSAVTTMKDMFWSATSANPDVSSWDISAVTRMAGMFQNAIIANPDVSSWNTSAVTDMSRMFDGALSANPDVSGWETSSVNDISLMFSGAVSFDQNIGLWDVTNLMDATDMFTGVTLSVENYDNLLIGWDAQALNTGVVLSAGNSNYCSTAAGIARANMVVSDNWSISDEGLACPPADPIVAPDLTPASDNGVSDNDSITSINTPDFYVECAVIGNTISLYTDNPAADIAVGDHLCKTVGVETVTVTAPLVDGVHNITYTESFEAAESGNSPSLEVTVANTLPAPNDDFVTTWNTENPGLSNSTSITVPMVGGPYNVDWNNDGVFDEFGLRGASIHDFDLAGVYTIRIRGGYDSILFLNWGDKEKIVLLNQWGTGVWKSMKLAFHFAINLQITAIDTPDFSAVTSMRSMFNNAVIANPNTSDWDTSMVTDMQSMFVDAHSANPDTSNWNTSAVTTMRGMFTGATSANPATSGWDTSSVTDMEWMFAFTPLANPDTSSWDMRKVENLQRMFLSAVSANPDTSMWDTSSVTTISTMFRGATSANPDVSGWNTSLVTNIGAMFLNATSANPDVSGWNTESVKYMDVMFKNATSFNHDLSSWDISELVSAGSMLEGVALSTANYDGLLIGWNAQTVRTGVTFGGGNSVYCSAAAIAARENLISAHGWAITDGGQGCPSAPAAPVIAPDLTAATDTGLSDSDNITANNSPQFEVVCSAINNSITLNTDKPTVNTAIGTHVCTSVGSEIATVTAVLVDGMHNITYIDQYIGERSGHSPSLVVIIDTVAAGMGSLSAPGSPINDINADITGSCGIEAANDTMVVTTSAAGGFTTLYNSPITLDGNGNFSILDPNWSEGTFTLHFECSDSAGNSTTLGPFGPILIDLSCSGADMVVTGNFPAGMHLCAGTNTLVTSGVVNLETGAVVYFQSPEITINPDFNVSEGASLISSSVVGPVAPLLLGPTQIKASVGEILMFSESHICEDYEDGVLAIAPFDTGVLVVSDEPEVFTLSCTDLDGIQTQMEVKVITE